METEKQKTWRRKYDRRLEIKARKAKLRRSPNAVERGKISSRAYYWANRDKELRRRMKKGLKQYGLSEKDYDQLLINQGNRCAICGDLFTKDRGPCVDHNHETGKVRGLLHRNCNTGLGMFQDSPVILHLAAMYLETTDE